jgi:hypothetical protein
MPELSDQRACVSQGRYRVRMSAQYPVGTIRGATAMKKTESFCVNGLIPEWFRTIKKKEKQFPRETSARFLTHFAFYNLRFYTNIFVAT